MTKGFFITGTDTGVGKTITTAALLLGLQSRSESTGVMKPVETGVNPACFSAANSDARFLTEIGEMQDADDEICPFRYKTAASPYQAGVLEGSFIDIEKIVSAFNTLSSRYSRMLVEGVGGLMVPLCKGEVVADLASRLKLPLIIVTRYQLGTQNHTLLTVETARQRGLPIAGLVFNKTDDATLSDIEQSQPSLLSQWTGLPILAEIPYIKETTRDNLKPDQILKAGGTLNLDLLLKP